MSMWGVRQLHWRSHALDLARNMLTGNKWVTFAIVAVGVFMATLDSSVVNVSLPAIAHHFGVPLGAAVEWIVMAYLVSVAALLLSVGRLADLVGRKTIWLTGLGIFTVASLACGAAPSLTTLIIARALQGIGGACLMAISPAMLTSAFPPEQRGRAIGLNAVTVGLGISSGPTLGGLITEHSSFRYIFLLNLPIGILGWIAAYVLLPREPRPERASVHFDVLGAVYLAIALASLTAGVSLGHELGWTRVLPLCLLGLVVLSALAFALHERRHPHPVVDFGLFRQRTFASACVSLLLSFIASFSLSVMLPFYFEQLRGWGSAVTGLMLTPYPLTLALIGPVSGSLADRFGTRWLAAFGMVILSGGLCALAGLGADNSKLDIIVRVLIAGVGQALFQSPNNSALMGSAPKPRQGLASGMLATGRVVGQSLSVAMSGAIFAGLGGAEAGRLLRSGAADSQLPALQQVFLHSQNVTFLSLAGVALLAAAAALGRERAAPRQIKQAP
jgi:EmrB/QacA subfamily drug resistance transporter